MVVVGIGGMWNEWLNRFGCSKGRKINSRCCSWKNPCWKGFRDMFPCSNAALVNSCQQCQRTYRLSRNITGGSLYTFGVTRGSALFGDRWSWLKSLMDCRWPKREKGVALPGCGVPTSFRRAHMGGWFRLEPRHLADSMVCTCDDCIKIGGSNMFQLYVCVYLYIYILGSHMYTVQAFRPKILYIIQGGFLRYHDLA